MEPDCRRDAISQRPLRSSEMKIRAFSLIELLVTISIIAVLIGILLPVLPLARDAARRVACGATLRGVGQGVELYIQDNKDLYPAARYMPEPWLRIDPNDFGVPDDELEEFNASLPDRMATYLDDGKEVWKCPGDKQVHGIEWTDERGDQRIGGTSYTYTSGLGSRRIDESWFVRRLGMNTSQVPVVYDFDGNTYETEDGRLVQVDFFHSSRNLLFADGHVGKFESAEGDS
ncbi:MAG: type II secretion system protein [Planctomycetota bacterium]